MFCFFSSRPRCARNKSDKQSGRLAIPCGNSWTRGKEGDSTTALLFCPGDEISSQIVGRDEAEKVCTTSFRAMDSLEQLPKKETIRLRKRHVGVTEEHSSPRPQTSKKQILNLTGISLRFFCQLESFNTGLR
uniref:Uncharacterized protein n=1 Tax=Timema genevievae TaxID=629358 RepID=A0A7R9JNS5_TIMGE|nr:unnamed protein product [Timema genevievae]